MTVTAADFVQIWCSGASPTTGNVKVKSKFHQLLRLLDGGHEKLSDLVAVARSSEQVLEEATSTLQDRLALSASEEVRASAAKGQLPKD